MTCPGCGAVLVEGEGPWLRPILRNLLHLKVSKSTGTWRMICGACGRKVDWEPGSAEGMGQPRR